VAAGKSVGEAPPLVSKTKFAAIGALMSEPALEVVDQTAGMQCGSMAQPVAFTGCGPLFSTSTVFCAARGATLSSNMAPQKNDISTFFIGSPYGFAGGCRLMVKSSRNCAN
jgi:hypothetical protein